LEFLEGGDGEKSSLEVDSFRPGKLGRSVLRPYIIEADVSSAAQK
jgi:hypothetical protein